MIKIGDIQIDPKTRSLQRGGENVHVGSRAFDILVVMASAEGRLVTKTELMDAVWPNTIVEENNIQVQFSSLRKILGPDGDRIRTVPGRGYQLAREQEAPNRDYDCLSLPSQKSKLFGRETVVEQIRAMLQTTNVLTLVGTGGIGKTSVAIEAARHATIDLQMPVRFVEMAALGTKEALLEAIIKSSGLSSVDQHVDIETLVSEVGRSRGLLVLDNAEHLIAEVAEIVEALSAFDQSLRILVTSREPLRIMAETVLRLKPLEFPAPRSTDAQVLECSAVKLFLQRVHASQGERCVDSTDIQLAGNICRRLDGIPLAIELAAGRVTALGLDEVNRRLDDRMPILTGGYRTAQPRQQTMQATFDWSFTTLDDCARSLFQRLAVFDRDFTFETMCAVACGEDCALENAVVGISELVSKSLVNVQFEGPVATYRLSESTRAYAMQLPCLSRQLTSRHSTILRHTDRPPSFA